jgi:hypothetical protein
MDYKKKKCKEAIKNIEKCYKNAYDDNKFFSCVINDMKDYNKYCQTVFENKTKEN